MSGPTRDRIASVLATATPSREWLNAPTTKPHSFIAGELIDWAAVERALNGALSREDEVTDDERYIACRMLAARGHLTGDIAERTLTVTRRVHRWAKAGWPEHRPIGVFERQAKAKEVAS